MTTRVYKKKLELQKNQSETMRLRDEFMSNYTMSTPEIIIKTNKSVLTYATSGLFVVNKYRLHQEFQHFSTSLIETNMRVCIGNENNKYPYFTYVILIPDGYTRSSVTTDPTTKETTTTFKKNPTPPSTEYSH